MNRFTKVIRGGLALFLGLAPLSCTQQKTPAGGPPRDPLAVTLAPVVAQKLERVVTVSGTLLAPDQSPLSVKVPGRVRSIAVDLGSRVQTGDLLAEIDPQDYQLRLNQAKAALAQARARVGLTLDGDDDAVDLERTPTVKQARAVLQEKQKDLDRQHALSTQGIASQAELEVAQAAYEVAINKYEDGLEEVKNRVAVLAQRRAEHDIARQQLSDTRLLAPFDGAIQDRTANVGQYLPVGTQVVKLVRTDPLRLRAEVSERDAPRIQLGQPVRLQVEGFEQGFTGRVGRLSPAITERSRMLILEADIPSQGVLRPGAFARVQVVTADATPALTVPTNALVVFAGLEKVFVARDGVADERVITTGDRAGDRVEVLTGVREGEAVVLNPGGLQTGRKLLVPPPEPAPPGRP